MGRKKATPSKYITKTLADQQPKYRPCLGCEKEFLSLGPGNRFCAKCKRKMDDRRKLLSQRQEQVFRDDRQ